MTGEKESQPGFFTIYSHVPKCKEKKKSVVQLQFTKSYKNSYFMAIQQPYHKLSEITGIKLAPIRTARRHRRGRLISRGSLIPLGASGRGQVLLRHRSHHLIPTCPSCLSATPVLLRANAVRRERTFTDRHTGDGNVWAGVTTKPAWQRMEVRWRCAISPSRLPPSARDPKGGACGKQRPRTAPETAQDALKS